MSNSSNGPNWADPYGTASGRSRGNGLVWALGGLVVVLLVALAGFGGYVLASGDDEPKQASPTSHIATTQPSATTSHSSRPQAELTEPEATPATACDPEVIARDSGMERRNVNISSCRGDWALGNVYVPPGEPAGDTQYVLSRTSGSWARYTSIPSSVCRQDAVEDGMPADYAASLFECKSSFAPTGDLRLSTPMTRPACGGQGIVVLYSAVTPGAYVQEVGAALAQYPGAAYLRTDMSCPSLRQRDSNGNVIYAVYRPSGYSQSELCADVRAAGGSAYGRWLDTTSDPSALVTC